jgi:uncharacterized protein GlcG (DUF336 family)
MELHNGEAMTRFICRTLGGVAGLAVVVCSALRVMSAESVFHDKPASVRSLPADNLPPFGMLDDAGRWVPAPQLPAGALHGGPGSPPESSARGPGLALSLAVAHAAVETCAAAGYRVGAAVIDTVGEARAMLTADGSDGSHVFVAMRKALAALEFRMPSSQAYAMVTQDQALLARVKPNMFVEGGAVPIIAHGELIGAIGVSGAAGAVIGQQDEACATAALRQVSAKLQ